MVGTSVDTVALFGLPLSNVTMEEAVSRVEHFILSGEPHQIATANLDFARHSLQDSKLQKVLCDCAMVLPDGAPMLWLSKLLGTPLKQRVTGVDLVPELAKLSAVRGYRIFFLGSSEESASAAIAVLQTRYPGMVLAGRYSPPVRPLAEMDNEDLLARIAQAKPDILLVAFGNPKQEFWLHTHRDRLRVPVVIGIGGTLDMIAGSLQRAPKWIQRCNLEWTFRMLQEPRRLVPRYFHDGCALLRHLPMVLAARNLQPQHLCAEHLHVSVERKTRLIVTPQTLSRDVCSRLQDQVATAVGTREAVVLDMRQTTRIEADGLGTLLEIRRMTHNAGLSLWLAEVTRPVRRVLKHCAMANLFGFAVTAEDACRLAVHAQLDAEWRLHQNAGVEPALVFESKLTRTAEH